MDLANILNSIPIPTSSTLSCRTSGATFHRGNSIRGVPNLTVQMSREGGNVGSRMLQTIWVMECASSQSDRDVTGKLQRYIEDIPGLLVVGKILSRQAMPFCSPGSNGSIARSLRSSELKTFAEWTSYANAEEFASVIADGFTWFSLMSVELHVWVRKSGESKIKMDEESHAYGVRLRLVYQP